MAIYNKKAVPLLESPFVWYGAAFVVSVRRIYKEINLYQIPGAFAQVVMITTERIAKQ